MKCMQGEEDICLTRLANTTCDPPSSFVFPYFLTPQVPRYGERTVFPQIVTWLCSSGEIANKYHMLSGWQLLLRLKFFKLGFVVFIFFISFINMNFLTEGVLAQIMMSWSSVTHLFWRQKLRFIRNKKLYVSHWSYSYYSSLHLSAVKVTFVFFFWLKPWLL